MIHDFHKGSQETKCMQAILKYIVMYVIEMDLFPNEQNFDLDNSRQKFHHNLKEHHKISNIPKFRCKIL
jgi:hypothetical protein